MKINNELISLIAGILTVIVYTVVLFVKPSLPWQLFFLAPVIPLIGLFIGGIAIFKEKRRNYLSYLGVSLNGFLTLIYSVIAYLTLFGRV